MSQWVVMHGADYVDGGIMAVPPMIGRQHALILYSGSRRAFDAHSRQLDALATSKYLGEDAGLAPLHDIALLAGMYGLFGGVMQALALTGAAGIPAGEFMPLLISWLHAMQGGLPSRRRTSPSRRYSGLKSWPHWLTQCASSTASSRGRRRSIRAEKSLAKNRSGAT